MGLRTSLSHFRAARRGTPHLAAPIQLASAARRHKVKNTNQQTRSVRGQPAEAPHLERDGFSLKRHLALSFCLSMISAQTLRVCREGKPVSTFPDHALESPELSPRPPKIRSKPKLARFRWRARVSEVQISIKLERLAFLRWCAVSNDRETGKKRECAAIMIDFRRNPDVV